jgi:NAD+ kinase
MKIKILANPKKQWAKDIEKELGPFLSGAHTVVKRGADATICIGGDGTILFANYKGRIAGPILGIGGDKSYICQLHKDDWKGKLAQLLASGKREKVMTIGCELGNRTLLALNDIVIHATHYRVAEMDVTVEGKTTSFEGDGMIISTALGSAAYAYSAGGQKISPIERKLNLVPICPYKRAFSPQMLPEDADVSITVGSDCAFITDGIFVRRLRKGERASVGKGPDLLFFEGVGRSF